MTELDVVTFWHNRHLFTIDGRLTKEQGKAFLAGRARVPLDYQKDGDEPCRWAKGDRVEIEPHLLSLEITNVKSSAGRWLISYRLWDMRPKLLGSVSGYTRDPGKAIGATDRQDAGTLRLEPEAVDDQHVGRSSSDMRSRQRKASELTLRERSREERRQMNRLKDTRRKAIAKGLDVTELDVAIERELSKLRKALGE